MSIGTAEGLVEIRGRGGEMANQNKFRELAEKQLDVIIPEAFRTTPPEEIEITLRDMERILRKGLKPLLDTAEGVQSWIDHSSDPNSPFIRLAAELEGWRKEQK